jgi:uridine kinase
MIIIGSGGTGAGKTTVAQKIIAEIGESKMEPSVMLKKKIAWFFAVCLDSCF